MSAERSWFLRAIGAVEHHIWEWWALGMLALFILMLAMLGIWSASGYQPIAVGSYTLEPNDLLTPMPTPTVTPNPEAEILKCRFVRVPGNLGADVCDMRDGETCVFDRGSLPTFCYPKASEK